MAALVIDAALIALGAAVAVFGGSPLVLGVFRLVGRSSQRRVGGRMQRRPGGRMQRRGAGRPPAQHESIAHESIATAPGEPEGSPPSAQESSTTSTLPLDPDITPSPRTAPPDGGTDTRLADPDLLPGGEWIGYLERLAVFATLTAGWKEGLALILAIKGLARYPELALTDSRGAEKFIIGTLASVLFAAGCAGVTAWLTGLTR